MLDDLLMDITVDILIGLLLIFVPYSIAALIGMFGKWKTYLHRVAIVYFILTGLVFVSGIQSIIDSGDGDFLGKGPFPFLAMIAVMVWIGFVTLKKGEEKLEEHSYPPEIDQ
jgi:hypothetical protein